MKKSEWNEGMNNIDYDLVEKYIEQKEKLSQNAKKRKKWIRFGLIAACFIFLFCHIIIKSNILYNPTYENAMFSAEEMGAMFSGFTYMNSSTNAYTKKYVPDEKYLYIDEIQTDKLYDLYKPNSPKIDVDREEFQTFIHNILPEISNSVNVEIPEYTIEEGTNFSDKDYLSVFSYSGPYRFRFYQGNSNSFSIYSRDNLIIDKEVVQIEQKLSDEEILNSLHSFKNKLFDIFGVSFTDSKIIRDFDSHHKTGATKIYVYFYNQKNHPLSFAFARPKTDYIGIYFDNYKNSTDDEISDNIIKLSEIEYVKYRKDISEFYTSFSKAKIISLNEAEKLLYNGYVFGGHSCPICMSMQDKISFREYDFVDIEYVDGYDKNTGKTTVVLPFYAFY
ncbi:MAG: hypothetical protein J6V36_04890, partial [Clostridia bacterium]|nr:hypothetical protein [Clostridia bacterium]